MTLVSASRSVTKDVPVTVCGRLCPVKNFDSVGSLQKELQSVLGVQEEDFDICDSSGQRICTDQQLESAISGQRLPLQAGLSDASVHLIENRREELAQMQWKVIRDKMQSYSADLLQLTRQMSDLQQQFEMQGKEHDSKLEVFRGDVNKQMAQGRSSLEATMVSLSERVQSFTNLVNGEKNKREHASKALENQLQELRKVLDQERHERLQEASRHVEMLKECKVKCEAQQRALEAAEQQRSADMQSLKVELARAARDWMHTASERLDAFSASLEDTRRELRGHGEMSKQALNRSQEAYDLARKIHDMEVKGHQLDVRLSQTAKNFSERQQSITERQEQIWELFEGVRADKQSLETKTEGLLQQVQDLRSLIAKSEQAGEKLVEKETSTLRDELASLLANVTADHNKQISDLDTRCSERFERESRLREKMHLDKTSHTASTNEMESPASPRVEIAKMQISPRGVTVRRVLHTPNGSWSVPPGSPQVVRGRGQTVPPQNLPGAVLLGAPGSPQMMKASGLYGPLQSVLASGSPRDMRTSL